MCSGAKCFQEKWCPILLDAPTLFGPRDAADVARAREHPIALVHESIRLQAEVQPPETSAYLVSRGFRPVGGQSFCYLKRRWGTSSVFGLSWVSSFGCSTVNPGYCSWRSFSAGGKVNQSAFYPEQLMLFSRQNLLREGVTPNWRPAVSMCRDDPRGSATPVVQLAPRHAVLQTPLRHNAGRLERFPAACLSVCHLVVGASARCMPCRRCKVIFFWPPQPPRGISENRTGLCRVSALGAHGGINQMVSRRAMTGDAHGPSSPAPG